MSSSTTPPSPHRGWYSRGYLPHFDHPGLLQFITYHLADSLPTAVLSKISRELSQLPAEQQEAMRTQRLDALLDAGYGSCILYSPEAAGCVVETWLHFAGLRYDLIAWVVMPNHVHVLIRAYQGVPLAKIVQSWKSFTGRRIRALASQSHSVPPSDRIWMREYWDRYIRDERHFQAVIEYIHQNPVKAGLVKRAEEWRWSSAADGNAEP